tara:strand:+ start:626 stop:1453 length:828 start_codon:yes stop_codon:yes gene_type:complete
MTESFFDNNKKQNDLSFSFNLFFPTKKLAIISIVSSLFISLLVFFLIPPKYNSKTVIVPAQNLNEVARQQSALGTFGGLIGFNSLSTNSYKFNQSIEILNSYNFFETFVIKYDLKDKINNEAIFFKGDSLQDAYRIFHNQVLDINFDSRKTLLTINARHSSPDFPKLLLDNLIKEINLVVKNEDVNKSKSSILFLEQKINETDLSEIKEGLSDLVQKQIEIVMIAESSPEYIFKTIDSAIVAENNDRNKYLIFIPILFVFSLLISIVLIRLFQKN